MFEYLPVTSVCMSCVYTVVNSFISFAVLINNQ